jgi:Ca-activated chloride channel family protein
VRQALFLLGVMLAAFAVLSEAARPTREQLPWRGVDVVLCLDVSRSMLARDVAPARLVRAQREIRLLAEHTGGERLGLVVFAGEARRVVPLTQDGASLAALADLADPWSVRRGGTDLGAALDVARQVLAAGTGSRGAIVLLTDGEDLGGGGRRAAARCRKAGLTVDAVGLGSPRGSKIAVQGPGGPGFLQDPQGRDVVSKLDLQGLEALTDAGGGRTVRAGDRPGALRRLVEDHILPSARASYEASVGAGGTPWRAALVLALLLWCVEMAWVDRRRA